MSKQIVESVRTKYPTPLGARHGEFLIEVARALGLGLVRKDWGTFVRVPDGTGVSQDCVMQHNGPHWDILVDGEGAARANWTLVTHEGTDEPLLLPTDRHYWVPAPHTPPPVTPPPPPPPGPDEPAEPVDEEPLFLALLTALTAIQAQLDALGKRTYTGTIQNRLLGTLNVTLTPKE